MYIIQHLSGMEKHISTDHIKNIVPPFIEYYANTLKGSSGFPVFVARGSVFVLIAFHCKGVTLPSYNWNKGVLISEILNHLNTGTCKYCCYVIELWKETSGSPTGD